MTIRPIIAAIESVSIIGCQKNDVSEASNPKSHAAKSV
jgi:hypothetical protein